MPAVQESSSPRYQHHPPSVADMEFRTQSSVAPATVTASRPAGAPPCRAVGWRGGAAHSLDAEPGAEPSRIGAGGQRQAPHQPQAWPAPGGSPDTRGPEAAGLASVDVQGGSSERSTLAAPGVGAASRWPG